jgi:hypothetical protein
MKIWIMLAACFVFAACENSQPLPVLPPSPSTNKSEEPKIAAPRFGDVCCLPGDQRCLKTYDPQGKGISCRFSDPCRPTECTSGPEPSAVECDKSLPEPGQCQCVDGFCLLHRKDLATGNSKQTGCEKDTDCSLDGPTGVCHVSSTGRRHPIRTQGPTCKCNQTSKACEQVWYEPVPCKDWRDCWYEREPIMRPIKAAKPRTQKIQPCKDGELDSICMEGICQLMHWSC